MNDNQGDVQENKSTNALEAHKQISAPTAYVRQEDEEDILPIQAVVLPRCFFYIHQKSAFPRTCKKI